MKRASGLILTIRSTDLIFTRTLFGINNRDKWFDINNKNKRPGIKNWNKLLGIDKSTWFGINNKDEWFDINNKDNWLGNNKDK